MASISINLKQGTLQPKAKPIVGIDLGTTHSLVAVMDRQTGKPVVLKKKDYPALVPSVIHFSKDGKILVGEAAKHQRADFPERTINSVKRLMGKSYGEVNQHGEFGYRILDDGEGKLVRVNVDECYYTPIELSALILKELKQMAEDILGDGIEKAVITVPAYFNDAQRQAVKDAGKLAGLEVMRIINEPTAAGLAYGIGTTKEDSRIIAVYDMGGGTFDVSILRITGGIFEVLATKGDTHLGGDDIDISIAKYWKNSYGLSATLASLHIVAEQAKKALSSQKTFVSQETVEGKQLALDSQTLAELMRPWVDKTLSIAGDALQDSGVHREDIETILMVGGSTRSPLIRDAVKDFFGKPVDCSIDPDEVVALGAAVQADILTGTNKEDLLLLDVTPLSLGIETMGGLMDVLMARNTSIPNHSSRTYTTQKDGQTHMRIAIFQGEREMVADNRKLGEFTLSGIPPMPAGLPKVHIRFVIDADGILSVSAKEERSGIEQHITVQPQYGLSPQDIEQLLASSIAHAKEDMTKRAHIEARVEAIQLAEVTQQFLAKNDAFLTEDEKRETLTLLEELDVLLKTDADKGAMFRAMDRLNAQTKPFAERLMNVAIKASLEGKTLD